MKTSIATKRVSFLAKTRDKFVNRGLILSWVHEVEMPILVDCDGGTLLFRTRPLAVFCPKHPGIFSCFHSSIGSVKFILPNELAICVIQSAVGSRVLMVGMTDISVVLILCRISSLISFLISSDVTASFGIIIPRCRLHCPVYRIPARCAATISGNLWRKVEKWGE